MPKILLKKLLAPLLTSNAVSGIASRLLGSGITIFMLHRILPDNTSKTSHTPAFLRNCLELLKNKGYHFVSLEDVIKHLKGELVLPNNSVAFTIDDGFLDQATLAAPVFIEFNCPLTIFLVSGFLDGDLWPWYSKIEYIIEKSTVKKIDVSLPNGAQQYSLQSQKNKTFARHAILNTMKTMDWDKIESTIQHLARVAKVEIPDTPPDSLKSMTWEMARELENRGVKFGPHTVTHPILSKVSDVQSKIEITHSWQRLKDQLSSPSPIFCYPNGRLQDFGTREIDIIKRSGFLGAVSTVDAQVRSSNTSDGDYLYKLPRYGLPNTFSELILLCSWIEYSKSIIHSYLGR